MLLCRRCQKKITKIFPSFFTTEGLNVPADSNVSPFGDTIGSTESRVHFPKGGVKETVAIAAKAMRTNADTLAVCAERDAEKETLVIAALPSLTKLPGHKNNTRRPICGD